MWTRSTTESVTRAHDKVCRPRASGDPYSRGRGLWVPAYAGTTTVRVDQSNSRSNIAGSAEMLLEKLHRERQRAVRLRFGIGLAAVAGEGVVGAGIFVDGHQRIG